MMTHKKRRTSGSVTIALCIVTGSLMIAFGLCEIIVRCCSSLWATGYIPSPDDRLAYELQPGFEITSLRARINSQGLNDREYSLIKTPGVFRIAVIGDSTSFGWMVNQEESFPKVLESRLNSTGTTKFEVINFSVPGYNTAQERRVLKSKVLPTKPDLVVWVMCPNDANLPRFIKSQITVTSAPFVMSYAVRVVAFRLDKVLSASARYGAQWIEFKKNVLNLYYEDQPIFMTPGLEDVPQADARATKKDTVPDRYRGQIGWDSVEKHLRASRDMLKARRIPLVVTGYFNDEMRAIVHRLGAEAVVDFWDSMRRDGVDYASLQLNPDPHMNTQGHHYVGTLIFSELGNAQLLPQREK